MVYQKPLKPYKQGHPIEFQDIGLLTVSRDSHRFYFNVPIEKCVWGYGWRYTKGEHPFLNFFELGESLDEFYHAYQPPNTLEALTLGFDKRPWNSLELPWHYSIVFVPDVKERKKHKNQHLGPLRPDRLNREKLRLTTVLDSIQSEGYQPEKYGHPNPHICGYFLLKDDDFLFYIEGGGNIGQRLWWSWAIRVCRSFRCRIRILSLMIPFQVWRGRRMRRWICRLYGQYLKVILILGCGRDGGSCWRSV